MVKAQPLHRHTRGANSGISFCLNKSIIVVTLVIFILRSNKGGKIAYVAVAGEGAALKNQKEALAFGVLQNAIGAGPRVKWSINDQGVFTKNVRTSAQEYASQAINVSYSDTGLFGILIASPTESAGQLVESAVKTLKSGNVTDEDVARGEKILFFCLKTLRYSL